MSRAGGAAPVLTLCVAAAVASGCAEGVKRALPGCPQTADRRPITPAHWPLPPPSSRGNAPPVAPGPATLSPAPAPAASEVPTPNPKPPWWQRLWSEAAAPSSVEPCGARRDG